jgi:hypothetical protein
VASARQDCGERGAELAQANDSNLHGDPVSRTAEKKRQAALRRTWRSIQR